MRKAITFMQSAASLYDRDITPARVVEISGIFPDKDVADTMAAIRRGTMAAARSQTQSIIASGYAVNGVLERLTDAVVADAGLASEAKASIVEKIAVAEKRLVDGADEELQLLDVLAHAARAAVGVRIPADKERLIFM
jgi:replication factor C subunit 2/4